MQLQVAKPASRALAAVPASPIIRRKVLPTAGVATAGLAAATWTEAPVIRNVVSIGEGVKRAAASSISWMGNMARGAGSSLGGSESHLLRMPFRHRQTMALASP